MVFYTLILQFIKKMGKKRRWYLSEEKKTEQKQNSATIMISVDWKGAVSFSSEIETTRRIAWIKIFNKTEF